MTAPVRKDDANDAQSITEVINDLKALTVSYAKQETVDPLRNVGRFLKFGLPGGICLAIGVPLLAISGLRALQTQTGSTFTGNLSWLPYLFTVIFLLVIAGLSGYAIFKDSREHADEKETP